MYFDWKQMPFEAPSELNGGTGETDVVVIGAGPVGLAMALSLARHGIRPIVLERRDRISDGSRALAMNRRSMQIFDQLGVGAAIMEKALTWTEGWTYFGRDIVHHMDIASPPHEKHGQTNLQQCWMEQIMLDQARDGDLADIRYHSHVTALEQQGDGVLLTVDTPKGTYRLKAKYVIGADGPRGETRKRVGLEYEGKSFEQRFVINDLLTDVPLPVGRRLFFSPPYLPGKTVLMHKAPFGMWRLDFQLQDDQDAAEQMLPQNVHPRIRAHFDLLGLPADYELIFTSVYKANALSLPDYQRGRVLIIGDAAHQVPIFGGRGVNHGYADVHNLGWKLAAVLDGSAPAGLLNSYTVERRGAIVDTLADLTKTTIFITTPSSGLALLRDAVLSLSTHETFLGEMFDPYASPPYRHADSALDSASGDAQFEGGCAVGGLVSDAPESNGMGRLYDRLGVGFTALYFGGSLAESNGDTSADHWAAAKAEWAANGSKLSTLEVVTLDPGPVGDSAHGPFDDRSGTLQRLLAAKPGNLYLIRPDNYVAARWTTWSPAQVASALDRALGRAASVRGAERSHA